MSAYIVDRLHIDLLVRLATDGPAGVPVNPGTAWPRIVDLEPDALGQLLITECVASVAYRYSERPTDGTLPGPFDRYYLEPYHYTRPPHRLTVPEALKAIDGYVYQSCEDPGWPTSEGYRVCDALRAAVSRRVDGYDAAPWTWSPGDLAGVHVLSRDPDGFTAIGGPA